MRGRNKKKTAVLVMIVIGAVGAAGTVFVRYQNTKDAEMRNQTIDVTETEAKLDSISNTIVGTGNLEAQEAVSLKIPSGITISQVKVESGDHVSKGDVLAYADTASVLSAIEEVQNEIASLDEEIYEIQEGDEEEALTVKVDGRVKKIYVSEGDDAAECMLENGALMLLSIDGKLGVDLEGISQEVTEGDEVTVTLSAGTAVTGTVESVSGRNCTVTLTDSGVGMGDTAVVTNEEGETIGTGITYIHQPLEVTGSLGTVAEINVVEDEAVESGDTLLTLDQEDGTEYKTLLEERETLAASLKELISLSENGEIKADMDGTIEEIYVSGEEDTSAEEESTGTESSAVRAVNMSYTRGVSQMTGEMSYGTGGFMKLSAVTSSPATEELYGDSETAEDVVQDTGENQEEIPEEEIPQEETPETKDTVLSADLLAAGLKTPETGENVQKEIQASDGSYAGSISWNPEDEVFQGGVVYQASFTLTAGDGYYFTKDSITGISSGVLSGMNVSQDGKTASFLITFPETEISSSTEDELNDGEDTDQDTNGNANLGQTDTQSGNQSSGNQSQGGTSGVSSGSGQNGSGQAAAGESTSSGTAEAASSSQEVSSDSKETENTEDASGYSTHTTAFTIAGEEEMVLSVSVDELDINSVEKGQSAEITFDAIADKTFEGTVAKVGNTASASGGVAKYTVEIEIPRDEEMKAGMNASATIVIESKENVVTIPVNALQERGNEVFVYTEKDEEGNLSGEQTVTTGLSDGETVEITDGLSEGDTVYYQKKGGQSSSSESTGAPGGSMEMPGGAGGDGGFLGGDSGFSGGGGMGGNPPERQG